MKIEICPVCDKPLRDIDDSYGFGTCIHSKKDYIKIIIKAQNKLLELKSGKKIKGCSVYKILKGKTNIII